MAVSHYTKELSDSYINMLYLLLYMLKEVILVYVESITSTMG